MSQDPSYFAARAIEERRLAMASADLRVRKVHLEMAAEYDRLAASDENQDGADDAQGQLSA